MDPIDREVALYWQQQAAHAYETSLQEHVIHNRQVWQNEAAYCYRKARECMGMPS